jgi:hypothetical protein
MLRKYTLYFAGFLGLILGSVGCGDVHPRGGTFDVAWNIDSQSVGGTSCERAGITLVTLSMLNLRTNDLPYTDFNCVDYGGYSNVVPAGDYSVSLYGYSGPPNPDGSGFVTSYSFPVSYHIDPDTITQLPVVSLVVR